MTEKPQIPILKQAALQIVSGGSAGFVEVCIMHPLDLVKTRLQIQNKKSISSASGVAGRNQVNDIKLIDKCSFMNIKIKLIQFPFKISNIDSHLKH